MKNLEIKENFKLRNLTTFKIGGNARYFVEVKEKEDLEESVKWAKKNKVDFLFLAGGSNVLINDDTYEGLVIKISNNNIKINRDRIICGAGASLPKTVSLATANSLTNLEWAIGIPGSIGGAIRGNAGAFGTSMSSITENLTVYNTKKEKFLNFSYRDCNFKYRSSIFKESSDYVIWDASLKLNKDNIHEIKDKTEKYLSHRIKSQPKLPSAGCVFKNLSSIEVETANPVLHQRAEEENVIKNNMVAAGWVIEQLGIKGKKLGEAKVSLEHANFIVNTGNAKAENVIALISYIKKQVRDRFKIQLHEEIEYFGY